MINESFRQTGRTTRLIREARDKKCPFIVHHHAFAGYLINLYPEMKNQIFVLSPNIHRRLSGYKNVVVDHAVYELCSSELLRELKTALDPIRKGGNL